MKIYTAATFRNQHRIRQMRDRLFKMGHNVLSTWLNEQVKPNGMSEIQFGRKMAAKDLREVQEADCFILDLEDPSKTAGKMVETGFALAHHKLVYVVGQIPPGGIFMHLADKTFNNWDELFAYFEENHSTEADETNKYVELSATQAVA